MGRDKGRVIFLSPRPGLTVWRGFHPRLHRGLLPSAAPQRHLCRDFWVNCQKQGFLKDLGVPESFRRTSERFRQAYGRLRKLTEQFRRVPEWFRQTAEELRRVPE